MRLPHLEGKKILVSAVSVVAVIPLVFSVVMLVAVPIESVEGKNLTVMKDTNNDGMMDFVLPSGKVYVSVGENRYRSNEIVFTGAGYEPKEFTFSNGTMGPFSNATADLNPSPLHFIDSNGDGTIDNCIFINFGDFSMILYRNDGSGTFVPTKSVNIKMDANPDYFAVIDSRELRRRHSPVNWL